MKPQTVGAFEAKTRLSELLDRVDEGAVYVITKRGRPVAELRPPSARHGLRFGSDEGRIRLSRDFEAPVRDLRDYEE